MQFSYSRVECFKKCQYQYKLRYLDKVKTYPDYEANNALIIGTALHTGIEHDVKTAIDWYYNQFPIITDQHIEEAIKLEYIIPKCKEILPHGEFEREIESENFIGYMDLLVPVDNGLFDLYDFKYSNNVESYLKSGQLHVYKYFFEKTTGNYIRDMYFLFAPKVAIRMKKDETQDQFRRRLKNELEGKEPQLVKVEYDHDKVLDYLGNVVSCEKATKFEKSPTRLCDWCEYKKFCIEGDELMILPKNERKENSGSAYKKIWLYGLPFSGKTYLADKFPNYLLLSTDGNYKQLPNGEPPHVDIKDIVQVDGHVTRRTLAWDVFKDTILELEKQNNDFETIVVDLLEDTYEHCRLWCYQKLGIEHESDSSFKAWDYVRNEFLNTIKKLTNLNYNIVLISHEDTSKDITKKGGDKITSIKPNIGDKVALKVEGMVDIVGRVINDEGKRFISFKANEVIFGGGRLQLKALEIPCDYNELMKIYGNLSTPKAKAVENSPEQVETTEQVETDEQVMDVPEIETATATPAPTRRTRRTIEQPQQEQEQEQGQEAKAQPQRRQRRTRISEPDIF